MDYPQSTCIWSQSSSHDSKLPHKRLLLLQSHEDVLCDQPILFLGQRQHLVQSMILSEAFKKLIDLEVDRVSECKSISGVYN